VSQDLLKAVSLPIGYAQWAGEGVIRVSAVPAVIKTDAELLRKAIRNLLINAIKYRTDGTPIDLRADLDHAGRLRLRVSNRIGSFDSSDLRSIFTPFTRGRNARRQGIQGTGLGLAIVKQIAVALGGKVSVHLSADSIHFEITLQVQEKKTL